MLQPLSPAMVADTVLVPLLGAAEAVRWAVVGPVAGGNEAAIYRASAPGGGPRWAIKVHRTIAPEVLSARYAAHRACADWMAASPGLAVPSPVALVEEAKTVVMEWAEEQPLLALLSDRRAVGRCRLESITRAGRWLRRFHDRTFDGTARFDGAVEFARLQRTLARRLLKGRRARFDAAFKQHLSTLEHTAGEVSGLAVPGAVLHGDFNAKNILQGAERTVGIDFAGTAKGSVAADICRFLVRLDGNALWLPGRGEAGPLGIPSAEQRAFLTGYGWEPDANSGRALAWMQLLMVLRRWSTLSSSSLVTPAGFYDRIAVSRLARVAEIVASRGLAERGERLPYRTPDAGSGAAPE
jgi:hypothetical protein